MKTKTYTDLAEYLLDTNIYFHEYYIQGVMPANLQQKCRELMYQTSEDTKTILNRRMNILDRMGHTDIQTEIKERDQRWLDETEALIKSIS